MCENLDKQIEEKQKEIEILKLEKEIEKLKSKIEEIKKNGIDTNVTISYPYVIEQVYPVSLPLSTFSFFTIKDYIYPIILD